MITRSDRLPSEGPNESKWEIDGGAGGYFSVERKSDGGYHIVMFDMPPGAAIVAKAQGVKMVCPDEAHQTWTGDWRSKLKG
jgi:hypothetical protein